MNRNFFFPRKLDYLFSFDLDLDRDRSDGSELSLEEEPEAMGSRTVCHDPDRTQLPPNTVYHALNESHVLGQPVLQGHVVLTQQRIEFLAGEDYADITGRLVLRTLDDVLIETNYHGVLRARQQWPVLWGQAGPGHPGAVKAQPGYRAAQAPARARDATRLETRAHISAHFETGSTKYAWLPQHQCIGYGKLTLRGGEAERASFDVYALGA